VVDSGGADSVRFSSRSLGSLSMNEAVAARTSADVVAAVDVAAPDTAAPRYDSPPAAPGGEFC